MKKFSTIAAIAAMIAMGAVAHAENQGDDAGAYYPPEPGNSRIAPRHFVRGAVLRCLITGIVFPTGLYPGSVNVVFENTHHELEPPQPVFSPRVSMSWIDGLRTSLIQSGTCPDVDIKLPPGTIPPTRPAPIASPIAPYPPEVGGPAELVPGPFPQW